MVAWILKKFLGSKNQRELKRMMPTVRRINELDEQFKSLSDDELLQSPGVLHGSEAEIVETLHRYRETHGVTYFCAPCSPCIYASDSPARTRFDSRRWPKTPNRGPPPSRARRSSASCACGSETGARRCGSSKTFAPAQCCLTMAAAAGL